MLLGISLAILFVLGITGIIIAFDDECDDRGLGL